MNQKLQAKSFTLGVLLSAVIAVTLGAAGAKSSTTVEYKVVLDSPVPPTHPMYADLSSTALNQYATEGWETVCSHLLCDHQAEGRVVRETVLKRTKK